MGTYKDLDVWKKGRVLRSEIQKLSDRFPSQEKYKLIDQIVRSSRSVTNNIAEGHGRFHYQENIQFCRISRGSLIETDDHLTIAEDCGYITSEEYLELEKMIKEVERMLNGYIAYLSKQKKN